MTLHRALSGVAFLAVVLLMTSHPASACSIAPPYDSLIPEGADVLPPNARFITWSTDGTVLDHYQGRLFVGDPAVETPARIERFGGLRVDLVPAQALTPSRTVSVSIFGEIPRPFIVGPYPDEVPPVLQSVGPPTVRIAPANRLCGAPRWVTLAVDVVDVSPVVVAVWWAKGKDPDVTQPTERFYRLSQNLISLDLPDDLPAVAPLAKVHYALMAIDITGRHSEIVMTPSGKRLPAVQLFATEVEEPKPVAVVSELRGGTVKPADVPVVSSSLGTLPPSRGCGCRVSGSPRHDGDRPLGLALVALAIARIRRTRAIHGNPS